MTFLRLLLARKMASIVNMSARSVAKRIFSLRSYNGIRSISTSEKKKDGAAVTSPISKDIPDFTKPLSQNWVSYGFDRNNETDDLNAMHSIFFFGITFCLMFGGFFFTYFPDFKARDWSHRQAFLELRRREAEGLPLVEMNYVDPAKIQLPTDEELGDRDIII